MGVVVSRLTLVALDCRPFDIMKSVSEADAAVYSPAVLRLRGQARASEERIGRTRGPVAPGHERLELRPPVDLIGADAEMDGLEVDVFGPNPAWRQGSWRGVSCHHKSHMALDSEAQREYASPISGRR